MSFCDVALVWFRPGRIAQVSRQATWELLIHHFSYRAALESHHIWDSRQRGPANTVANCPHQMRMLQVHACRIVCYAGACKAGCGDVQMHLREMHCSQCDDV